MKVFILKPSSLGDVVQALPVLRLIKLHRPDAQVFWWLDAGLTSLLEGDPDLAGIVPFERQRWSSPLHWGEVWTSLREIRARQFDWVIDLQSLARSGLCAWLANGGFTERAGIELRGRVAQTIATFPDAPSADELVPQPATTGQP